MLVVGFDVVFVWCRWKYFFDYVLDEAQCKPNKQNFGTSQLWQIMSGLHAQIQLQECSRQLKQNEYKMLTYFY